MEEDKCKPLSISPDMTEITFEQLILCEDVLLSCYVPGLCDDDHHQMLLFSNTIKTMFEKTMWVTDGTLCPELT